MLKIFFCIIITENYTWTYLERKKESGRGEQVAEGRRKENMEVYRVTSPNILEYQENID